MMRININILQATRTRISETNEAVKCSKRAGFCQRLFRPHYVRLVLQALPREWIKTSTAQRKQNVSIFLFVSSTEYTALVQLLPNALLNIESNGVCNYTALVQLLPNALLNIESIGVCNHRCIP
jgi:hypothetical protein